MESIITKVVEKGGFDLHSHMEDSEIVLLKSFWKALKKSCPWWSDESLEQIRNRFFHVLFREVNGGWNEAVEYLKRVTEE